MKALRLVLLVFTMFLSFAAKPQDVEFSVSAPSVVAQGEQFRLIFNLNARPQEFKPPSFDKFYILAGPSTSSSSSVEIVNGKMTQTFSYTYTYILEATTEGKFTIEPATIVVAKKEYKTDPFTIEVVKGTTQQSTQQHSRSQSGTQTAQGISSNDLFTVVELDRTNIYRGQAVLATIKLYRKNNYPGYIVGFEDIKYPSFTGFWNQEVETPTNITFQRVNVDGKIYDMGVLRKYLLFPQRSGEISIDPFEIVILMQQRSGRQQSVFDEFFGAYQTIRKKVESKPIKIKVKDLPTNAPASFSGAVGKFSLDAKLDKQQIKTNEAINLQVKISGSGNIRLIETPKIQFPGGFETFDPKVTDNINTTSQGASGSKTFEYVAIPRTPGNFDLSQVEFSYFDPSQDKYITLKSNPLSVQVENDGSQPSTVQVVGFGKEDVRFIGKDIRFIKNEGIKLNKKPLLLFGSNIFISIILVIIALSFLAFLIVRNNIKLRSNIALVRTRKANKVARKRLKLAHAFLAEKNGEKFHDELMRAMWGYVSDKFSIPVADLSSDTVRDTLTAYSVKDADVELFVQIITTCEYARYAPKSEPSQMSELYQKAHDLISDLEGFVKV